MPKFLRTTEGVFATIFVSFIIVLFGFYFYSGANTSSSVKEDIAITAQDHVRGNLEGKVTLVKFADYQCPACGAYEPIVKQLLNDNKQTLKVVHKHFPLTQIHRNALPAAMAAEAAGVQGKFWEMNDILYAKQSEWSGALNARDYFLAYATTIGLNVATFEKDLSNKTLEEKVLAELREGVRLKVQGTPTFFLNGQKINNPRDLASFDALIKKAAQETTEVQ
ncbi:MAG: hypothetical protein RI935_75 [Candidatus Parcubacteria bacterium]|jgi:protein-disulfide isomerase